MTFEGKQRFSVRKYSFGLASVLLGTLFVGAHTSDHVQANEIEGSENGIVTLAPDPDVVVEVTQTPPTEGNASNTEGNVIQSELVTQPSTDQSLEGVGQETSAETNSLDLASSEENISHKEISETPVSHHSDLVETRDTEGQQSLVVETSSSKVDTFDQEQSEVAKPSSTILRDSVLVTDSGDITVPVRELDRLFPPAGVTHLTEALNAALIDRNRGRSGFRSASFTNTADLSLKISAVTARGLLNGYFVDMNYIENLKIGLDYSGMPWAYDFKIENPTHVNGVTGNVEPQIHYEAHVPLTRLGTIDYVDENGKSIAGGSDQVTFNNASDTVTVDGHNFVDVYDAGVTNLPKIPRGYRLKWADSTGNTKVLAYVDVLEDTAKYSYKDGVTTDDLSDPDYLAPRPDVASPSVWSKGQKQEVSLILQADGQYALDPSINANNGRRLAPGYRYHLVVEEDTKAVSQSTSQTVLYVGAGSETPAQNQQNDFTFTGLENNQTQTKVWDTNSHHYQKVTSPVISGYYADKIVAGGELVTPDRPQVVETVTYKPLGKIIPVDEAGQVITGVATPIYANNLGDPTKADVTLVPVITGYTASLTSVSPLDPGQDTRVVYIKDDQKAVVAYLDETTGQYLAQDHLSGKSGDLISYSTADKIAYYQDRGYVLVKVDFPSVANFDHDKSLDQVFTVTLKHDTVDLGPNHPHEPGGLINPNDPTSPQWPAKENYDKTVRATVSYVSQDQQAPLPSDKVQTAQWSRTLTLDKVTGQVLSATAWVADKANYDLVLSPVLDGYFVDKAVVASKPVTQDDIKELVTYSPMGRIIPVDSQGNPIPNAPRPNYHNDPNDPTKATLTLVPEIPGYRTETISVNPEKPGQDSLVVYVPMTPTQPVNNNEEDYIVIIYRDEAGNQIRMPKIISSAQGRVYDDNEDRYINRNGVVYERIRQEGDVTGRTIKGRTTVTYIYRRVDEPKQTTALTSDGTRDNSSRLASKEQAVQADTTDTKPNEQIELPETGEDLSHASSVGLGLFSFLAGLGLLPSRRKSK